MRLSQLFAKPSKNEGLDYKIDSHRLLTQAGFIRESTAGRYYMLPLGIKVHQNIEKIIRDHMNKAGAQELIMPVLHPIDLWEETNRTTTTGFELMKVEDRRGAEFALGGTAEEMAVDLVRKFNISYRDLPFNIYQFSMKFRDELRARGGLLRVREFVMKDAYSFSTEEQFQDIYEQMWDAYINIFADMDLKVDVAAADNGYIGGEYCHEFIVESEVGESRYLVNSKTGEAWHEDVAVQEHGDKNTNEKEAKLEEVDAPRGKTMEDGAKHHNLPMWQQIKDVLYFDEATDRYVLAIIRGDLDVNEAKLTHVAKAWDLRAASDEEIIDDLNSAPGFISPVGFVKKGVKSGKEAVMVADKSLRSIRNAYGGANKKDKDLLNINIDRDYQPDIEGDIAMAEPNEAMIEKRGIEVGNIFQLGYHYSNLMDSAEYTSKEGKREKYYMGCYGIGLGRTMAAIVETHQDEKGIIWPASISPASLHIVAMRGGEDQAEKLYESLVSSGVEVIYDDRDLSAGAKLADADLIGVPLRAICSEKTSKKDVIEVTSRSDGDTQMLKADELLNTLKNS
ncbi:MAG: proline--tRNA ligase [Candidatus Saccharimonadales bacterium]